MTPMTEAEYLISVLENGHKSEPQNVELLEILYYVYLREEKFDNALDCIEKIEVIGVSDDFLKYLNAIFQ